MKVFKYANPVVFLVSTFWTISLWSEVKVAAPIAAKHVELSVIERSEATSETETLKVIQSKLAQLYVQRRDNEGIGLYFSYIPEGASKPAEAHSWERWLRNEKTNESVELPSDDATIEGLTWAAKTWKSKTLNLRWFVTSDAEITDATFAETLGLVSRLDIYHVGRSTGKNTPSWVAPAQALAKANPDRVSYQRLTTEVSLKPSSNALSGQIPVLAEKPGEPVPVVLSVVDFSTALMSVEATATVKSVINMNFFAQRQGAPKELFYSYNRALSPMNGDLNKWFMPYQKSYRGRQGAEQGLEAALHWAEAEMPGSPLVVRWYTAADERVHPELLKEILESNSLEIYHVGPEGEVAPDDELLTAIKQLQKSYPDKLRYFRLDAPLEFEFTE